MENKPKKKATERTKCEANEDWGENSLPICFAFFSFAIPHNGARRAIPNVLGKTVLGNEKM